LKWAI